MSADKDPFAHHPELRGKIIDPQHSFFRNFKPSDFDDRMKALGLPPHWRLSDEEREAMRRRVLAGRPDGELWVFAYGSLMWDPGFDFVEVRKAHVGGYARAFCLKDELGARGTREAPGLMAALDEGPGCTGLVFRIDSDRIEEETAILWRREMATGVYIAAFVDAVSDEGPLKAVTFVANHDASRIRSDLTHEEQVRYIATGEGVLGSSLEYIENLADKLAALDIDDAEVSGLLDAARRYAVAREHG
ncbi:gamma-glutamylcyclotransferase [Nitratireductor sp. XY-223]|uniref:gamma-glutamylcyclotransferase n=1 Tax=Nitratireductor sp. XY-223 TaxID=2561926 RepID=UPI0010A9C62C|nr:gamma-glutamylcyclotransferase [Nitratireductor sp. XY-223]